MDRGERRPNGEPTNQPQQQHRLQQEKAEDYRGLQGRPKTFDDHEPDAYQRDPVIFQNRTLEGMKALREKIEHAQAQANFVAGINRQEEAKQIAQTGQVDLPFFLTDNEIRTANYERGLRDAFNLIVAHLQGEREQEEKKDH